MQAVPAYLPASKLKQALRPGTPAKVDDSFIRKGYFGGATDYYQLKAENIHYYDVNSLYPFAKCKPMPFKLIRKILFHSIGAGGGRQPCLALMQSFNPCFCPVA